MWRESSLIQGMMALGCTGTIGYLYATEKAVPNTLLAIVYLILGYYFGSKTQQRSNKERRDNVTQHNPTVDGRTEG